MASITYKGRRLAVDGWTVEFHADSAVGFPEDPPHTCYFPGKVVLVGACDQVQTPQGAAHFHDLQHFFQRRWQKAAKPTLVDTDVELHAALNAGSPRLVYYYGPASQEGLLLVGADGHECCMPWSALVQLL